MVISFYRYYKYFVCFPFDAVDFTEANFFQHLNIVMEGRLDAWVHYGSYLNPHYTLFFDKIGVVLEYTFSSLSLRSKSKMEIAKCKSQNCWKVNLQIFTGRLAIPFYKIDVCSAE